MNKKKILFLSVGSQITASSRMRVYNYRPFLEKGGFKVKIIPYNMRRYSHSIAKNDKRGTFVKLMNKFNQFFKCILYLALAPHYDVIYIQRVLLPRPVFAWLRAVSKKIIFDFDDAIYLADKWSQLFLNKNKFLKRFKSTVMGADCVVVSNNVLADVSSKLNSHVVKMPTPVDTQGIRPKGASANREKVVVGWIGSPQAAKYVEPLKKPLEELAKKYPNLMVRLVGAAPLSGWKIDVAVKNWSLKEEADDLHNFDIGIMPLDEDEWSTAKSGYKLLQYMAAGLPSVASPVGVSKEIIDEGVTGFLAKTPEEWMNKLSMLIDNSALRGKMGIEGRKKAETVYSYQVNAPKLINLLKNER